MRLLRTWLNRCLLAWAVALVSLPAYSVDSDYLLQLQKSAQAQGLAQDAQWLNLLHFKPYVFLAGSRSLADDPKFFNSPVGKTDASAELDATLASFFSSAGETDKTQNPQCAFIARYRWLGQKLQFDPQRLPPQPCKRFQAWREALNPHEVTLIFPDAFMNSPSSMYGHTLLRIDAKDQDAQTRLLGYAINYAATTDEPQGFSYAYKGLTGGYPGMFSSMPYYLKVREYNDFENRDIWEYRLNLKPQEIERMLMHLWELGPIRFDYFFIDENCSYHLMSLLEVARPGLQLTDQFRWAAIPADTVRAVTQQAGLLKEAIFRPSSATVIRKRLQQLTPEQQYVAKQIASGDLSPNDASLTKMKPQEKAAVIELSIEYQHYLRASKGDWPAAADQAQSMMIARSKIDVHDNTPVIPMPATRPDQGHKTSRLELGAGVAGGAQFQELRLRPTYHDLMDPEGGYTRGAQIQFFKLTARHYQDKRGLRMEEFVPIDILSLAPRDEYFQRMSWKVNAGATRVRLPSGNEPMVSRINIGVGGAWNKGAKEETSALTYLMLDATLDANHQLKKGYAVGLGPAAGLVVNITDAWRVNAYGRVQRYVLGDKHTSKEIKLDQRFSLGSQSALRLDLSRKQNYGKMVTEASIYWQYYY